MFTLSLQLSRILGALVDGFRIECFLAFDELQLRSVFCQVNFSVEACSIADMAGCLVAT